MPVHSILQHICHVVHSVVIMFLLFPSSDERHNAPPSRVLGNLPQEYDLVRFIKGMENVHPSWVITTPACEWKDVYCDANGRVDQVLWGNMGISGVVEWGTLPYSVRKLNLGCNFELGGTVDLGSFPQCVEEIGLFACSFVGALYLTSLPTALLRLNTAQNMLSGLLDFTKLPAEIQILRLSENMFGGTADFSFLPASVQEIDLRNTLVTSLNEVPLFVEMPDIPKVPQVHRAPNK